jgi:hypothetical protein
MAGGDPRGAHTARTGTDDEEIDVRIRHRGIRCQASRYRMRFSYLIPEF